MNAGGFAAQLRRELALRNRLWAQGRSHVESYGGDPVIVYAPDGDRHGNFYDPAYAAILARPEWKRRLNKVHAQGRSLPKLIGGEARKWRELDSSNSSDALLMNVFCAPGVLESTDLRSALCVDQVETASFGWKAKVPLRSGLVDRTEVDMRLGSLLIEAKLTEGDFQTRAQKIVESYRDFEEVFEPELLPGVVLRRQRRREAAEFAEEFTQEWEAPVEPGSDGEAAAREFQAGLVERAWAEAPAEAGYAHYQLIRNVLAAYAYGTSFCVIHDQRRPDLREAWFSVMTAVKNADMRVRLKVFTWQEIAVWLPAELQEFLDMKYGIVAPGKTASSLNSDV